MRVLLSLRKLHLQRTVNGCNGYKSALLKPRGAVYASSALRISRWSSSFSSSTHSSTGSTEDSGLSLISDTKNTLPVKFDEQANVEGAETQVIIRNELPALMHATICCSITNLEMLDCILLIRCELNPNPYTRW